MTFNFAKKTAITLCLTAGLFACASNDEDPDSLPAERPEIQNQLKTNIVWSKSIGDGVEQYYSRLKPAIGYEKIFMADRSGSIAAFEQEKGKTVWRTDIRAKEESYWRYLGLNFSPDMRVAGLVASYEKLFIGCENGDVIALNEKTGEEIWRTKVLGEVLAPPIAEEGKVIINLGSGTTVALDAADGKLLWESIADVPSLTIRGNSSPAYAQGGVFIGSAGGKVLTYAAANGQLAWDVPIAKPKGATDLARIVDVDATPIISGTNLFVLSAGGALSSIDVRNARVVWNREYRGYQNMTLEGSQLYLSDDHSVVYSLDSRTGIETWSNLQLRNRQITAGVIFDNYYVVGDFEGYLYFFNKENGELSYIRQLDDNALLAQPIVQNGKLFVQTRDGELYAIELVKQTNNS